MFEWTRVSPDFWQTKEEPTDEKRNNRGTQKRTPGNDLQHRRYGNHGGHVMRIPKELADYECVNLHDSWRFSKKGEPVEYKYFPRKGWKCAIFPHGREGVYPPSVLSTFRLIKAYARTCLGGVVGE